MRWIDQIHRWTGAIIGVLLALIGISGTLLIHKDAWLRATVSSSIASRPAIEGFSSSDEVLQKIMTSTDAPSRPVSVLFPTKTLGLYTISYGDGAGAYADESGAIVTQWSSKWERPELWLFDFHHHLFAGDAGTTVAGIFSLVGLGFVITGVVMWWRTRREFRWRLLPSSLTRLQIIRHHRDLGLVMTPFLVLLFLTGAMLVFRPIADTLFSFLSPGGTITASLAAPTVKGGALSPNFDWQALVRTVRSTHPEAELRGVSLSRNEGALIRVRMRQPEEWLPNGRTLFWFDPADARLIESRDSRTLPAATRAYNAIYPLHASKIGGALYKLVMTAAGLTLTLLGSLAVYSFWGFRARCRASLPLAHAAQK